MSVDSEMFEKYFGNEQVQIHSVSGVDESFLFLGFNGELEDLDSDEEIDEESDEDSDRLLKTQDEET